MNLVSIRVITSDIARLVAFYEQATQVRAVWATEEFAELNTPQGTLAIGSTRTVAMLAPDTMRPAENRSVIIEFLVEDVDGLYKNLSEHLAEADLVNEPTTMPWGNRSLLVRDPDGNLVNFFTPVTPAAIEKSAR